MKFYIREYGTALVGKEYPCVVLTTDPWNDYFVAETLFHAKYYENSEKTVELDDIKIMHKENSVTRKIIPKNFEQLDDSYCSLGQTVSYYELIKTINQKDREEIISGLNDVAILDKYRDMYDRHRYFINSLIRFSEASKVLDEAKDILSNREIQKNNYDFSFHCKLKNSETAHEIEFNFNENQLPYRINAFVGKNATGKTSVLNEIAKAMSGINKTKEGIFDPKRPAFSKVITISYSAFDEMYKPFEDSEIIEQKEKKDLENETTLKNDENKLFSYIYCGLRSSDGLLTINEMEMNFWKAYKDIKKQNRLDTWKLIMSNIFEEEYLDKLHFISEIEQQRLGFSEELSSGQNILIYTMTEVIANIKSQSLLMFDEPETHLHPNAVANFMRLFYTILNEFDSYAIVSTHSPLIIQEIPSQYINVFNRYGNNALVEKPQSEFFGENISNITNELFEVQENESNYKSYLKKINETLSVDEILELFEEGLSFNALTYLYSLKKEEL